MAVAATRNYKVEAPSARNFKIPKTGGHENEGGVLKLVDLSTTPMTADTFADVTRFFSQNESYSFVPDIRDMQRSSLKTQLIAGSAIYIFRKSVSYTVLGSIAGMVVGAVGGIFLGARAGHAANGDVKLSQNVDELYKDFQILKATEEGIPSSIRNTINIAHNFFESFLEQVNSREMSLRILCPISKDVMMIPVKTNCGHVFELLNLTNSLKISRQCPECRESVEEAILDFQTIKAIHDALTQALKYLEESAGSQKLLLLQIHFTTRGFTQLNSITTEKIKNKKALSIEETRTLFCITKKYKMNFDKVSTYIKNAVTSLIADNLGKGKITINQFSELNSKLQGWNK